MGFAMQSFSLVLTFKTPYFTYLGVQNTAPLGLFLIQLNTPFILVESHLL
jgi:hypothetical protein